ncbi:10041_t:CDS:2, partial [Dentiscutata erythropus]
QVTSMETGDAVDNISQTILPPYAFYGWGPQVGPTIFLTDNSNSKRNALKTCWLEGYTTQNKSFYISLYARPMLRNQEILYTRDKVESSRTEWKEPKVLNEESEDTMKINNSNFTSFLEEVRSDYQNADQLLKIALDKFKDRYNSAKSKSVL